VAYGVADEVIMPRAYPEDLVPCSFGAFSRKRSTFERTKLGGARVDRGEAAGQAEGVKLHERHRYQPAYDRLCLKNDDHS